MPDLALGDQVLDRARYILDRHIGVDAVLIKEVNHFRTKPLERLVAYLADVFGSAVHAGNLATFDVESEFGCDYHLVAHRRQRLANNLLVGVGTINLGSVEEGDTALHRLAHQRDALPVAQAMAVAEIQPHAAEADRRDFQAAFSEYALLHRSPLTTRRPSVVVMLQRYAPQRQWIRRNKLHEVISKIHERAGHPAHMWL
jgi:hypothetical protein